MSNEDRQWREGGEVIITGFRDYVSFVLQATVILNWKKKHNIENMMNSTALFGLKCTELVISKLFLTLYWISK